MTKQRQDLPELADPYESLYPVKRYDERRVRDVRLAHAGREEHGIKSYPPQRPRTP